MLLYRIPMLGYNEFSIFNRSQVEKPYAHPNKRPSKLYQNIVTIKQKNAYTICTNYLSLKLSVLYKPFTVHAKKHTFRAKNGTSAIFVL